MQTDGNLNGCVSNPMLKCDPPSREFELEGTRCSTWPKYGSHEIAFRGLVNCAYDGCTVTSEIKKGKYVYYRCTCYHGKCDLPRFKEEELAERLGEPLKHLQVPRDIVEQIVAKKEL